MAYIPPGDVVSPKARLQLVKVLIDSGPDAPAYALANWDGHACIVFRWNGNDEQPIGNPQSRGLPTWVVLDGKPCVHQPEDVSAGRTLLASSILDRHGSDGQSALSPVQTVEAFEVGAGQSHRARQGELHTGESATHRETRVVISW